MSKNFNISNKGNQSGNYPLYFGEDLGIFDSFNVPYPEIREADQEQRSLFWTSDEIDFTADYEDMLNVSEDEREMMIRTLSFQMAADSIASGSIQQLFLPIASNPYLKGLVSYHGDSEYVHEDTYGRIIAQCFDDPSEMIERIKKDEDVIRRLGKVLTAFKDHMDMVDNLDTNKHSESEKKSICLKTLVTLLGLEGIMFLSSFAATFALCESTNRFNGIGKAVALINNDEAISHVNNVVLQLNIIKNKEKWAEWDDTFVKEILDVFVKHELEWAETLFQNVKGVVGFNAELLKDYVLLLAKKVYDRLGLQFDHKVVTENPFPWIKNYVQQDTIATANQEAQNSNYIAKGFVNDVSEDETFTYSV